MDTAMSGSEQDEILGAIADERYPNLPERFVAYYCPICKSGTERSWHPVGRAGLIPQTQDEHECVKVDVSALVSALNAIVELGEQSPYLYLTQPEFHAAVFLARAAVKR